MIFLLSLAKPLSLFSLSLCSPRHSLLLLLLLRGSEGQQIPHDDFSFVSSHLELHTHKIRKEKKKAPTKSTSLSPSLSQLSLSPSEKEEEAEKNY